MLTSLLIVSLYLLNGAIVAWNLSYDDKPLSRPRKFLVYLIWPVFSVAISLVLVNEFLIWADTVVLPSPWSGIRWACKFVSSFLEGIFQ